MINVDIKLFLFLIVGCCLQNGSSKSISFYRNKKAATKWDIMTFSQEWPPTVCNQWTSQGKSHTCDFPNFATWTVHGLWPTKSFTKGPNLCSTKVEWHPEKLEPLVDELEHYWTNIHAGTGRYEFWKYEWNKHGTCATSLDSLNSLTKYFHKALELNRKYDLFKLLSDADITPGGAYFVEDIIDAVAAVTDSRPSVRCAKLLHERPMVSEIRICFDKKFNTVDCTDSTTGGIMTNCNLEQKIFYGGYPH